MVYVDLANPTMIVMDPTHAFQTRRVVYARRILTARVLTRALAIPHAVGVKTTTIVTGLLHASQMIYVEFVNPTTTVMGPTRVFQIQRVVRA
jgi:hypothetical protein